MKLMRTVLLQLALGPLGAPAFAWSLPELQGLLQAQPARALAFEEVRESPWLAAPRTSRGTLHSSAQGLEKRVSEPRAETWRLLSDRMEWVGAEGQPARILRYADAPAVAALAGALRLAVAGDLGALQDDFRIELGGNASLWTARLGPRRPEVARSLDHLELQGTQGRLQVIIVHERSGERTTTRLQH